jgi:hypothetical protein
MPLMFNQGMGGMTMPFLPGPRMLPRAPYGGMPFYGQSSPASSNYSSYKMMPPYSGAGGSGYGGGGGNGGGNSGAIASGAPLSDPAMVTGGAPNWLGSLGLPSDGGKLVWPLGLRVLAPASELQPLRQRIDALLPILAAQASPSAETTTMSDELQGALRQIRQLLAENGDGLAEATRTEASRFLTDMGRAIKKLQS